MKYIITFIFAVVFTVGAVSYLPKEEPVMCLGAEELKGIQPIEDGFTVVFNNGVRTYGGAVSFLDEIGQMKTEDVLIAEVTETFGKAFLVVMKEAELDYDGLKTKSLQQLNNTNF